MSRSVSIILLLQQSIWLLVVLPGHQRGSMTLAGYTPTTAVAQEATTVQRSPTAHQSPSIPSCCAGGETSDRKGEHQPADAAGRLSHCAYCHLALRLQVATPPDFVLQSAGLVAFLPPPTKPAVPYLPLATPFDRTGPPSLG